MRFGPKSITSEHLDLFADVFSPGQAILELGSGPGTEQLAKTYTMYSVEDDPGLVRKYQSNYIHAPLSHTGLGTWYDIRTLKNKLPREYDGIFVDGPGGKSTLGRIGFWVHHSLFRKDVPIVIDDVNEEQSRMTLTLMAWSLRRPYEVHRLSDREVGVIRTGGSDVFMSF